MRSQSPPKTKRLRNEHVNLASFPQDLIIQILLFLPLESILACKRVSKQWRSLINNPSFVKQYHNKSSVLFLHKDNLYSLHINDHHERKNTMRPRCIPIGQLNRDKERDWRRHDLLLESSNKRVCVKAANGEFHVYDLLNGDAYEVPDLPLHEHEPFCKPGCYGFGYDRYADDYKILVVSIDNCTDRCNLTFVYSFRHRGWKSSKGFPEAAYDWQPSNLAAYCFNGALHWVVQQLEDEDKNGDEDDDDDGGGDDDDEEEVDNDYHQVVAALDLHSGRLTEIALPGPSPMHNYDPSPTLGELDGHLCCCDYGEYGDSFRFDVWVLKEYGNAESWTKLLSIDDDRSLRLRVTTPFDFEWMTPPVLYSKDGRGKVAICVCHDSKLRLFEYDVRHDKIRVLHTTTWIKEKVKRKKKMRFKEVVLVMVGLVAVLIVLGPVRKPTVGDTYGESPEEEPEELLGTLLGDLLQEIISFGFELLAQLV